MHRAGHRGFTFHAAGVRSGRGCLTATARSLSVWSQCAAPALRRLRHLGAAHVCRPVRVVPRVYALELALQRGGGLQPGKSDFCAAGAGTVRLGHSESRAHVGLGAAAESRPAAVRCAFSPAIPRRRTSWNTARAFHSGSSMKKAFLIGAPNSRRYPDYFNINLHLERRISCLALPVGMALRFQ